MTLGDESIPGRFCCEHTDDFMYHIGLTQPDFEIGFAKWLAAHEQFCGSASKRQ